MNTVFAALQLYVSAGPRFARTRVIRDFIGVQDVIAKIDLRLTMQFVSIACLLKLICDYVDDLALIFQGRSCPAISLGLLGLRMGLAGAL